jgi:hypothetical protein
MKNILALLIVLISCSYDNKQAFDYTQNRIQVEGKIMSIDCFIANPYSITYMDTLLVFYDRYEGKTITLFNLKNNQCEGRFVSEGNGPGEVIVPTDVLSFPQKDELYFSERHTGYLNIFDISQKTIRRKIPFEPRPEKIYKMRDYYVCEGFYEKGRFGIYDLQGKLLRIDGQYPFRGKDMEQIPAFMLYQGSHCANPHGNYFAMGCLFCDHLSFYEVREDETVLLKKYASHDTKAKYPGQLVIEDDCLISYTWAYGTDKHCYMLYSGKTSLENEKRGGWGTYVIVFDWMGNYVKTWETDMDIRNFCVDETNNLMYAVVLDDTGEYGIARFKI